MSQIFLTLLDTFIYKTGFPGTKVSPMPWKFAAKPATFMSTTAGEVIRTQITATIQQEFENSKSLSLAKLVRWERKNT